MKDLLHIYCLEYPKIEATSEILTISGLASTNTAFGIAVCTFSIAL